jgi:hypothetical protein
MDENQNGRLTLRLGLLCATFVFSVSQWWSLETIIRSAIASFNTHNANFGQSNFPTKSTDLSFKQHFIALEKAQRELRNQAAITVE